MSNQTKQIVNGIENYDGQSEEHYWYNVVMDGELREIQCPVCQDCFNVEPDASYTRDCGCGVTVQVPEPLV